METIVADVLDLKSDMLDLKSDILRLTTRMDSFQVNFNKIFEVLQSSSTANSNGRASDVSHGSSNLSAGEKIKNSSADDSDFEVENLKKSKPRSRTKSNVPAKKTSGKFKSKEPLSDSDDSSASNSNKAKKKKTIDAVSSSDSDTTGKKKTLAATEKSESPPPKPAATSRPGPASQKANRTGPRPGPLSRKQQSRENDAVKESDTCEAKNDADSNVQNSPDDPTEDLIKIVSSKAIFPDSDSDDSEIAKIKKSIPLNLQDAARSPSPTPITLNSSSVFTRLLQAHNPSSSTWEKLRRRCSRVNSKVMELDEELQDKLGKAGKLLKPYDGTFGAADAPFETGRYYVVGEPGDERLVLYERDELQVLDMDDEELNDLAARSPIKPAATARPGPASQKAKHTGPSPGPLSRKQQSGENDVAKESDTYEAAEDVESSYDAENYSLDLDTFANSPISALVEFDGVDDAEVEERSETAREVDLTSDQSDSEDDESIGSKNTKSHKRRDDRVPSTSKKEENGKPSAPALSFTTVLQKRMEVLSKNTTAEELSKKISAVANDSGSKHESEMDSKRSTKSPKRKKVKYDSAANDDAEVTPKPSKRMSRKASSTAGSSKVRPDSDDSDEENTSFKSRRTPAGKKKQKIVYDGVMFFRANPAAPGQLQFLRARGGSGKWQDEKNVPRELLNLSRVRAVQPKRKR